MNFNIEEAVEKIVNNPHFLKLKKVVENNAYHHNESVFDHLIKTYKFAKKEIKGNFIRDVEVKTAFESYINVHIDNIPKRDLMLIFALIHDVGKIVVFKENDEYKSIVETDPHGKTKAPYHEYWGSLIVRSITEGTGLSEEHGRYLSNCVRLHGTFNGIWSSNKDMEAKDLLPILKKASEGAHVEQIFNGYCDCFSATPFQPAIKVIHELFNIPETYEELEFSF